MRALGTSCHKQTLSKDGLMRLFVRSVGFVVLLCMSTMAQAGLVVTYNPYGAVDWATNFRSLSQLHDHVATAESNYRAYDAAGYNAVSVMHYSGVLGAYQGSAWQWRRWPLSDYLPNYNSDQAFLATCQNLKTLIPNAEEVGFDHISSPFLTSYIAKWEPAYYANREPWHYSSAQECIDLIRNNGGMAFIAHPINMPTPSYYNALSGYAGIEIYSAYLAYSYASGAVTYNGNSRILSVWDSLLQNRSTLIWGIAANDWYGPQWNNNGQYREVKDSGKTLVMVRDWSLEEYRDALTRGAFFAVKDIGIVKRQYPVINSISVQSQSIITISTPGFVKWVSNGALVSESSVLNLATLPETAVYVRAEISNEFGTLYSQAFTLGQGVGGDPQNPPEMAMVAAFVAEVLNPGPNALSFDANGDRMLDGADVQLFMDGLMAPPLIRFPQIDWIEDSLVESEAVGCGEIDGACACHPPD
jgi:hypothetical protein